MSYDLVQSTEEFMTRTRFRGDTGMHFYPSEGSVKVVDASGNEEVLGNCLRASYFRCIGERSAPHSVRTQFIFALGKHVEDMLVEIWKKMGIFEAQGVRFYNPEFNVSGELDVVLRNPSTDTLFGVEVKSFYGYYAGVEIMGNKSKSGRPKWSQLLQTLIYAKEFEGQLDHFKMWYQERGDGQHRSFDVRAVPTERDGQIIYLPEVDNEILTDFTVTDVYNRYLELGSHLTAQSIPDREFEIEYDDQRIEDDFACKKLSKSKYDKFKKKGERPGDWQCSYCNFKSMCWTN